MVDSLLEMHLSDMGCGAEEFAALCATFGSTEAGREVLEQVLAVDDFVSFKKMMSKRNMELELESLKALQDLSEKLEGGGEADVPPPADEDDYEAQLQQALELSMKEAAQMGIATGVDNNEIMQREEEAEDADLKMALALSLQLEEEKVKMDEEAAHGSAPPTVTSLPAMAPPPPPQAVPARSALPPAPMRPVQGGLAPLGPVGGAAPRASAPPPMAPLQRSDAQIRASETAARAQQMAAEARERDREQHQQVQQQQVQSMGEGSASASEMRARAEHLKKQRDLIVAQRKKARDAEAAAHVTQPPVARAPPAVPPSSALKQGAGFSSGGGGPPPVADAHRARLSVALASSMKASLLGEDAATLDLQNRVDAHEKKLDLEHAKAQLRAEAQADRDGGHW